MKTRNVFELFIVELSHAEQVAVNVRVIEDKLARPTKDKPNVLLKKLKVVIDSNPIHK